LLTDRSLAGRAERFDLLVRYIEQPMGSAGLSAMLTGEVKP